MAAVRVPPSACSTSQSRWMVRSPRALDRSNTARSERPIRRWISCVRPVCLPRAASRSLRVCVARGSMPYSAVTQPSPLPLLVRRHLLSTEAVHSTLVSAELDQHRAFGVDGVVAGDARRGAGWSAARPPVRMKSVMGGCKRGKRETGQALGAAERADGLVDFGDGALDGGLVQVVEFGSDGMPGLDGGREHAVADAVGRTRLTDAGGHRAISHSSAMHASRCRCARRPCAAPARPARAPRRIPACWRELCTMMTCR